MFQRRTSTGLIDLTASGCEHPCTCKATKAAPCCTTETALTHRKTTWAEVGRSSAQNFNRKSCGDFQRLKQGLSLYCPKFTVFVASVGLVFQLLRKVKIPCQAPATVVNLFFSCSKWPNPLQPSSGCPGLASSCCGGPSHHQRPPLHHSRAGTVVSSCCGQCPKSAGAEWPSSRRSRARQGL